MTKQSGGMTCEHPEAEEEGVEAASVSDHPIPQRQEAASQASVSGSSHIGAHRQNDPAKEGKVMNADEEEELIQWLTQRESDAKTKRLTNPDHERLWAYFAAQEYAFGEVLEKIRQMRKARE